MTRKRRRRDGDTTDPDNYASRDAGVDTEQVQLTAFDPDDAVEWAEALDSYADYEEGMQVQVEDGDGTSEGEVVDAGGPTVGVELEDGETVYVSETAASDDDQRITAVAEEDAPTTADSVDDPMQLGPADEAGADVELETSPAAIEEEFDIDLGNTHTVEGENGYAVGVESDKPFQVLDREEQRDLVDTLEERHEDVDVDSLMSTLQNRKANSNTDGTNQRGELLVKRAIGAPGKVRNQGDIHIDGDEVSEAEVEATRDIVRVSRAFAREHYADENGEMQVHRGLREEQSWDILHRTVERPGEDSHPYDTGIMESHATVDEVTYEKFDDNVAVSYTADVDDLAYAIDAVTNTTMYEAEVQMVSRGVEIEPEDSVVNVGSLNYGVDGDVSLEEVETAFESPEEKDANFHKKLERTLNKMADRGRTVDTEEGTERLHDWAEALDEEVEMSDYKVDSVKDTVEQLTGEEPD